ILSPQSHTKRKSKQRKPHLNLAPTVFWNSSTVNLCSPLLAVRCKQVGIWLCDHSSRAFPAIITLTFSRRQFCNGSHRHSYQTSPRGELPCDRHPIVLIVLIDHNGEVVCVLGAPRPRPALISTETL